MEDSILIEGRSIHVEIKPNIIFDLKREPGKGIVGLTIPPGWNSPLDYLASDDFRAKVRTLDRNDPRRVDFRSCAMYLFHMTFNSTQSQSHLENAISFAEELEEDFSDNVDFYGELVALWITKVNLTEGLDDVNNLIRTLSKMISMTPEGARKDKASTRLAFWQYFSSTRSHEADTLRETVQTCESNLEAGYNKTENSLVLGMALFDSYYPDGEFSILKRAVRILEVGVSTADFETNLAWIGVCKLVEAYLTLYKKAPNPAFLSQRSHLLQDSRDYWSNDSNKVKHINKELIYTQMVLYFREPDAQDMYHGFRDSLNKSSLSEQLIAGTSHKEENQTNKNPSIAKYTCPHLKDTKNNFRLVEIAPGHKETEISCRLLEFPLLSAPEYEALSYTWGDPKDTYRIIVNGLPHNVTRSLRDALIRLRSETSVRLIWADALCIDQTNIQEKQEQIPLMFDIYSRAKAVTMWLGKPGRAEPVSPPSAMSPSELERVASYHNKLSSRLTRPTQPSDASPNPPVDGSDSDDMAGPNMLKLFQEDVVVLLEDIMHRKAQVENKTEELERLLLVLRPIRYGCADFAPFSENFDHFVQEIAPLVDKTKLWDLVKTSGFESRLRSKKAPYLPEINWAETERIPSYFDGGSPMHSWPTLGALSVVHLLARNYHLHQLPFFASDEDLEYPQTVVWRRIAAELNRILTLPYWQRAWILQEIVCSQNAVLYYGEYTIEFLTLVAAATQFERHYDTCCAKWGKNARQKTYTWWTMLKESFARVRWIQNLREEELDPGYGWTLFNNKPLFAVLTEPDGPRQATDARDIVYGVLGVVKKLGGGVIPVDYSISVEETYARATVAAISEEGSLQVLLFNERGHRKAHQFRSWTPDYAIDWKIPPFNRVYKLFKAANDKLSEIEIQTDLCLRVQSVAVDRICKVGPQGVNVTEPVTEVLRLVRRWQEVIGFGGSWAADEDLFWRALFGDVIPEIGDGHSTRDSIPRPDLKEWGDAVKMMVEYWNSGDKYHRIQQDDISTIKAWYQWLEKQSSYSGPWTDLCSMEDDRGFHKLTTRFLFFTNISKILLTHKGRIGIGPSKLFYKGNPNQPSPLEDILIEQVEVGDEIHVVYGCNLPLILRPLNTTNLQECEHQQNKVYKLIGSCYANGIMDGEAINSEGISDTIYLR